MSRASGRQSRQGRWAWLPPGEEPEFDEKAMAQVGVSAAALERIKEDLEASTVEEIRTVVAQCM
jgi:hypothetical protein